MICALGDGSSSCETGWKACQGTISYTVSPVHTIDLWLDLARRLKMLVQIYLYQGYGGFAEPLCWL